MSDWTKQALAWIEQNPAIFAEIERIAMVYVAKQQRFSIDAIGHIIRWERKFLWSGDFKVNNNHLATVADELIRRHPAVAKYVQRRKRGGCNKPARKSGENAVENRSEA